jgi:hypothetical protein
MSDFQTTRAAALSWWRSLSPSEKDQMAQKHFSDWDPVAVKASSSIIEKMFKKEKLLPLPKHRLASPMSKFNKFVVVHNDSNGNLKGVIREDAFITVDLHNTEMEAQKELADVMIEQWEFVESGELKPRDVINYFLSPCRVHEDGDIVLESGMVLRMETSL